ncbi:hypothetical protein [Pontibacter fetidus]|uniref:Uncharacterized protein n=1 Tax=Pontibacter fetidus TaxID=2700082 RepID=A0A6B2H837_9BACT|nr:hypothetical protein [Pontibacter fetidus]NDK57176.1 hypothetical protein [Pontibacter fetidus]
MDKIFITPEIIKSVLPAIIGFIFTGLASVIIGVYLEKFKNKITVLKRKISSQPIAFSTQDDHWGHIKVIYNNDYEAKNLNLFTVEIFNQSSKDITNIVVDLNVDNGSVILANNGVLDENNALLLLTNEFFNYQTDVNTRYHQELERISKGEIDAVTKQLQRDVDFVTRLRRYHVPVLNRESSATFNLLVENYKGEYPEVTASITHASIRVKDYVEPDEEQKRTLIYSIVLGSVFFVSALTMIFKTYPSSSTPIILTAIAGVSFALVGFTLYKIAAYFKKILS